MEGFLGAGLYGETLLQICFAAIGVYGWIKWSRGASGNAGSNDLLIRKFLSPTHSCWRRHWWQRTLKPRRSSNTGMCGL